MSFVVIKANVTSVTVYQSVRGGSMSWTWARLLQELGKHCFNTVLSFLDDFEPGNLRVFFKESKKSLI